MSGGQDTLNRSTEGVPRRRRENGSTSPRSNLTLLDRKSPSIEGIANGQKFVCRHTAGSRLWRFLSSNRIVARRGRCQRKHVASHLPLRFGRERFCTQYLE